MSDWYTIPGKHTGEPYLVTADGYKNILRFPGDFTLPGRWQNGLAYYPNAGRDLPKWLPLAHVVARIIVGKRERAVARRRRRAERRHAFAEKRLARQHEFIKGRKP